MTAQDEHMEGGLESAPSFLDFTAQVDLSRFDLKEFIDHGTTVSSIVNRFVNVDAFNLLLAPEPTLMVSHLDWEYHGVFVINFDVDRQ